MATSGIVAVRDDGNPTPQGVEDIESGFGHTREREPEGDRAARRVGERGA
jgi:hypothetical protein